MSFPPQGSLLRLVHYPAGLRQPVHAHEKASLTLVLDGALIERVGRQEVQAGAGQWCQKPVGVEHETLFGPAGATTLQLCSAGADGLAPALPWQWGRSAAVSELLWALLAEGLPSTQTELLADLEALLSPCVPEARAPAWWLRAHQALCEGQDSVVAVATDCGVHRTQLVRVAQQFAGCSPVLLRQRARLGRCLAQLARDPGLTLSAAALDNGFADQAHFNRACRRWLGQQPGCWRQRWASPCAEVLGQTSSSR